MEGAEEAPRRSASPAFSEEQARKILDEIRDLSGDVNDWSESSPTTPRNGSRSKKRRSEATLVRYTRRS